MTKLEWLNRANNIDKEIETLSINVDSKYSSLTSATSSLSSDTIRTNDNTRETSIINYIELKRNLKHRREELCYILDEIMQAINQLKNSRHRNVLLLRHIYMFTFPQIAQRLEIGEDAAKQLHRRAVKTIEIKPAREKRRG